MCLNSEMEESIPEIAEAVDPKSAKHLIADDLLKLILLFFSGNKT